MHIDSYEFGRIVVDGRAYSQDLILLPDGIQDSWWRQESHLLQIADLCWSFSGQSRSSDCRPGATGQNAGGCSIGRLFERESD